MIYNLNLISQQWDGKGGWIPSTLKKKGMSSTVNIMVADDLAT